MHSRNRYAILIFSSLHEWSTSARCTTDSFIAATSKAERCFLVSICYVIIYVQFLLDTRKRHADVSNFLWRSLTYYQHQKCYKNFCIFYYACGEAVGDLLAIFIVLCVQFVKVYKYTNSEKLRTCHIAFFSRFTTLIISHSLTVSLLDWRPPFSQIPLTSDFPPPSELSSGRVSCAKWLWPPCVADADIIFLPCGFYLCIFSSPNLSGRRLDIYHTSTHGVALVRI